jgi:acyl carrier protein
MDITVEKFVAIIKEALELEHVELNDFLDSYDTWDSLGRLSLIALIDEHFDIQISDKEFNEFETVSDVFNSLYNKNAQ